MNSYTKKEIARQLNVNYSIAHGVIEFLVARGIAKPSGKVETGAVGKPSITYEIPDNFTVDFAGLKITPTSPCVAPAKPKKVKAVKAEAPPVEAVVADAVATPVAPAHVTAPTPDSTPIGVLTENPAELVTV